MAQQKGRDGPYPPTTRSSRWIISDSPADAQDGHHVRGGAALDPLGDLGVIGDQAAADLAGIGAADDHGVAAGELALDLDHAGRQQAGAGTQRRHRTGVDGQCALRLQRARDPAFARGDGVGGVRNQVQRPPSAIACSGCSILPEAISICVPPVVAILAASTLVRMPPRDSSEIEAVAGDAESELSRGGMRTKVEAAKIATTGGTHMLIASGKIDIHCRRSPTAAAAPGS